MKTAMAFNVPSIFSLVYDFIMVPADWCGIRTWRKWATSLPGLKIIEIGIGTGLNLPHCPTGSAVFAIDAAGEMLHRAAVRSRKTGRKTHLVCGKAEFLPFPSSTFDAAFGTLVFCSVDDQKHSMEELHRVLKPGARVRFFEHVRLQEGLGARVQDLLTPAWKRAAGGCHLNRNTPEAVMSAGFQIRRLQRMLGGVFVAIDAFKP